MRDGKACSKRKFIKPLMLEMLMFLHNIIIIKWIIDIQLDL